MASEAADDVVLALNEAATKAILYGSTGGQPVQVAAHVNDDVIQASVLDHGPDLRPSHQPMPTPTRRAFAACGCCAGGWMRCGLSASGSEPGDAASADRPGADARPLSC